MLAYCVALMIPLFRLIIFEVDYFLIITVINVVDYSVSIDMRKVLKFMFNPKVY